LNLILTALAKALRMIVIFMCLAKACYELLLAPSAIHIRRNS
jgi:hypothetical protein